MVIFLYFIIYYVLHIEKGSWSPVGGQGGGRPLRLTTHQNSIKCVASARAYGSTDSKALNLILTCLLYPDWLVTL